MKCTIRTKEVVEFCKETDTNIIELAIVACARKHFDFFSRTCHCNVVLFYDVTTKFEWMSC